MNNKKLLIVLISLGLIFLLTQLFNQKKERSFKSDLVVIDTSTITKIILNAQADSHHETILEKTGNQWTASQGSLKVPAEQDAVQAILRELITIKVKSIVTQAKDRWKEYEIEDSTGSRVQVFAGSKKLTDFYSGKFGFNPQANSMISYIRINGEPQVYAVDGFQSMSFNPGFSNFRDKALVRIQPESVNQLKIKAGLESQSLAKNNNQWILDGKAEIDSTSMATYLQGLMQINGTQILDNFKPVGTASNEVELVATDKTISIQIFPSSDSLRPFIFHSTSNSGVYFKEDSTGAFNSLITGWKAVQSSLIPKK